jgi:hypothetical protein
MADVLIFLAASTANHGASKTPFYLAGGVLATWALLVGALGVARPAFAQRAVAGRAVLAGTLLLTLVTAVTAVTTAS